MNRFNENIDYFRGLSILIVVLFHYTSRFPQESLFADSAYVTQIFSFGWSGVYIFFVVSGYCIAGSFARSGSALDFMAKRIARIYPPFVAASCLIYFYQLFVYIPFFEQGDWSFSPSPVSFTDFFFTTFFMARDLGFEWVDGAYWTLLIEMKFYFYFAVFGAISILANTRILNIAFGCVLPAIWAASIFAQLDTVELILRNVLLAPYFPFFMLGVALAAPVRNDAFCILLAGITVLIIFIIAAGKPSPVENPVVTTICFFAIMLLFFLAVYRAEAFDRIARKIPLEGWIRKMGLYSFSWYLIHQKLGLSLVFFLSFYLGNMLSVALTVLLTFGLSVIFAKIFEHRFQRPLYRLLTLLTKRSASLFGRS